MQNQTIYVSATPGPREMEWSQGRVAEQIVRPTGLIDPKVTVKPLKGQIDDLIKEARKRADAKERVLVTTLTKRTAEELTDYLRDIGINVRYLHSEIDAIERVEILRALRKGEFDVLVGINLLREGLDLPEVSLVAILDADKEGYLRSTTSLIQTAGRAARHLNGEVILYADVMTQSIQKFLAVSRISPRKTARLQPGAQHHPAQREPRGGRKPVTRKARGRIERGSRAQRSRRELRHHRNDSRTRRGNAGGGEQPGVREGRVAARSDPRTEARRWPQADSTRQRKSHDLSRNERPERGGWQARP